MLSFSSLLSEISRFLIGKRSNSIDGPQQDAKADKIRHLKIFDRSGNFDADYRCAIRMLRNRLDAKYPDSYHVNLKYGAKAIYVYGEERALAVDTMSAAVAIALRDGATIKEAAEAGAASANI